MAVQGSITLAPVGKHVKGDFGRPSGSISGFAITAMPPLVSLV